jgi:hypothetical protein
MTPAINYALLGSIPIGKCDCCGADYLRRGGRYCGACKAVKAGATPCRGTAPPEPVAATYRRVRVIAPGSSWRGREGLGRETSTGYRVDFGDGAGEKSFRKPAVEKLP